MSFQLQNLPEFSAALRKVEAVTKKAEVEILNKALKDVAYRAASFTPKATREDIFKDLYRDKIGIKLAVMRMVAKGEMIKQLKSEGIEGLRGERITRQRVSQRTKQLLNRRMKRVGYQRAGWFAAISALGGKIRRSDGVITSVSALGGARKASIAAFIGEIWNNVYGKMRGKRRNVSMAKMESALQKSIIFVTADRLQYAEKKLKEANAAAQ